MKNIVTGKLNLRINFPSFALIGLSLFMNSLYWWTGVAHITLSALQEVYIESNSGFVFELTIGVRFHSVTSIFTIFSCTTAVRIFCHLILSDQDGLFDILYSSLGFLVIICWGSRQSHGNLTNSNMCSPERIKLNIFPWVIAFHTLVSSLCSFGIGVLTCLLSGIGIIVSSLMISIKGFFSVQIYLHPPIRLLCEAHCMKSVQIRIYFWSLFFCIRTEYRKIRTRNNSVFGHFHAMALTAWRIISIIIATVLNISTVWYLVFI